MTGGPLWSCRPREKEYPVLRKGTVAQGLLQQRKVWPPRQERAAKTLPEGRGDPLSLGNVE